MNISSTVKTIGIILAAILALIQIWEWSSKMFEKDLVAHLSYGEFKLPVEIDSLFHRYNKLGERPNLDTVVAEALKQVHTRNEKYLSSDILREMSYFIQTNIPERTPFDYSDLSGYWSVDISNEGSKALSSVMIYLPYASRVSIHRMSGNVIETKCTETIQLGILQPSESASLFVWTKIAPSSYSADKAMLTHDAGIGKVYSLAPTGRLGQWVDNNFGLILYCLAVGFVWLIWTYIMAKQAARSKTTNA